MNDPNEEARQHYQREIAEAKQVIEDVRDEVNNGAPLNTDRIDKMACAQASIDQQSQRLAELPEQDYREPIPLLPDVEAAAPYPLDALGDCLGGAARAIVEAVQVPEVMAAQTVLAAAAMAAQAHANVKRDGQLIPLSLYFLTVAESGDRKSSADRWALRAHHQYQKDLIHQFKAKTKEHRNYCAAHQKARSALLDKVKDNPETVAAELGKLVEPEAPVSPFILSEEPTIEGLEKSLLHGQPSQGLFSDEGGQFFGGYASKPENILRSAAWLSKRWDGAPLNRTRGADGETASRSGCKLSVHLMTQPIVATTVLNDPILKGQGVLGRLLIAWPESLAGTRFYREIDPTQDRRLGRCWQRMAALLEREPTRDEHGELDPSSLILTPEAMTAWIAEHDAVEGQLGPLGDLQEIKATAAKSAENLLRIAGVMAIVEDRTNIGADLIERAARLMHWYLGEALRITNPAMNPQILKAQQLLEWLLKNNWHAFEARALQQRGPRCVRKNAAERNALLGILVAHHWLFTHDGKQFSINPLATTATTATTATGPMLERFASGNALATNGYSEPQPSPLSPPVANLSPASASSSSELVAVVANVAAPPKYEGEI
ncbi:YfjI family protein [Pseudomonas sp. LS44]|uniref:YfjI family protein n=1 Tax=Pseudomonas sp. LS44 TaxID=1357074 RepID=UPI00215B14D7|nr:YfjI family protein [Pseudomonas sp. LS44]UVE18336.1 YfjI family protein [Pseudomonas sp. LS44]